MPRPLAPPRPARPSAVAGGAGLPPTDRLVARPSRGRVRAGLVAALAAVLVAAAWAGFAGAGETARLAPALVVVSEARVADFQPYTSALGRVAPEETVRLDAVEGGLVEAVLVRDGDAVAAGTPVLRLANPDLQLRVLAAEAESGARRDRLADQELAAEATVVGLRQAALDADHALREAEDALAREEALFEIGATAERSVAAARRAEGHARAARDVAQQALAAALRRAEDQRGRAVGAARRIERSAAVTRGLLAHLVVRAPVAGVVSGLAVQAGTVLDPGDPIGALDRMGAPRVVVELEEHYLGRMAEGTGAEATVGGAPHALRLVRILPEVRDGRFAAEFAFDGPPPAGLRKGEGVRLRIRLGEPRRALVLPRGAYLDRAADGLFVVTAPGEAERRPVRLGEQNPDVVEVAAGLAPGDRVVTSSTAAAGDARRLSFSD